MSDFDPALENARDDMEREDGKACCYVCGGGEVLQRCRGTSFLVMKINTELARAADVTGALLVQKISENAAAQPSERVFEKKIRGPDYYSCPHSHYFHLSCVGIEDPDARLMQSRVYMAGR